jgi:hypothetical protein
MASGTQHSLTSMSWKETRVATLKEIQDAVAFKLGELSMGDEALMEILSIGRADLVTHLIEVTIDLTAKYLEPINE